MKKIALAAALVLSTVSVSASEFDDIQVDIISWCDGSKVMTYDSDNNVSFKYDCAARGESCRNYQIVRFNWVQHIASCSAN